MQLSPQHAQIYRELLDVGHKIAETGVQSGIPRNYRALYPKLGIDGSWVIHGVPQFLEASLDAKVFRSPGCQTSRVPPPCWGGGGSWACGTIPPGAATGATTANGATVAPPSRTGGLSATWGWVIATPGCWGWRWFVKSAAASTSLNMTGYKLTTVFLFPVVPPLPVRPRKEPNIWSGIIIFYDRSPIIRLAMILLLTHQGWGFAVTHFWCPTK
jgi:hypothetical protein